MGEKRKNRWNPKKRGPYTTRKMIELRSVASASVEGSTHSLRLDDSDSGRKRPKVSKGAIPSRPGDNLALLEPGLAAKQPSGLLSCRQTKQPEVQGVVEAMAEATELPPWSADEPDNANDEDTGDPSYDRGEGLSLLQDDDDGAVFNNVTNDEERNSDPTVDDSGMTLTWTNVASLVTATGTTRLSSSAYQTLANFRNWRPTEQQAVLKLPSVSTLRRTIRALAKDKLFVPSKVHMLPVDFKKSGARAGVGKYSSRTHAPTVIVKPSDWAKIDFSTKAVQDMVEGRYADVPCEKPKFFSIEDTPIVRERAKHLSIHRIPTETGEFAELRQGLHLSVKVLPSERLQSRLKQAGFAAPIEEGALVLDSKVEAFSVYQEAMQREGEGEVVMKGRRKKTKRQPSKAFLPSDLVVHLRPHRSDGQSSSLPEETTAEQRPKQYAYLVYRMWRRHECNDDYAVSLVVTSHSSPSTLDRSTLSEHGRAFLKERVKGVEAVESSFPEQANVEDGERVDAPSRGVLKDGRRYAVYRMLLYSDGFTPYVGKKGSMGGVYMLPLGMLPEHRNGAGAVRPIGLTPPGVSTNEVLAAIIEDIIEGTTMGFETTDSNGETVVIFLDVVGYVGDYPAVSHLLDLLGHTSNVPCHLCIYGRYDKSGGQGSKYAYTTSVNSDHPSFSRCEARGIALRGSKLTKNELRCLGMDDEDTFETSLQALHHLALRLEDVRDRVPRTLDGNKPVVPARLDSYRSCIVAPDHLFLGLGRDILNACISLVPPVVRRHMEVIAKEALRVNYLIHQESLISHEKHVLHSMTISSMYCVLFVAPRSLRSALTIHRCGNEVISGNDAIIEDAISLLSAFSSLICRSQYYPDAAIDGAGPVMDYNEQGGEKRLNELRESAKQYASGVDALCRRSQIASIHLDKPNLHRLLEFYTHTLPLFGSVRHVQELLFEGAHQPMKRGVAHSNMKNAQVQAMEHRLANDWKTRLAIETENVREDGSGWSTQSMRSVLQLLGYNASGQVDTKNRMEQLQESFPAPVVQHLRLHRKELISSASSRKEWRVEKSQAMKLQDIEDTTSDSGSRSTLGHHKKFLEDVRRYLKDLWDIKLNLRSGTGSDTHSSKLSLTMFQSAKWCKITSGERLELTSCLATIRYESVVQSVCTEIGDDSESEIGGVSLLPSSCTEGKRSFWMVVSVFQVEVCEDIEEIGTVQRRNAGKTLYCAVKPCHMDQDGEIIVSVNTDAEYILELTSLVRIAMVMHCCGEGNSSGLGDDACVVDAQNCQVNHTRTLGEGGVYQVWGRLEGFPPRRA